MASVAIGICTRDRPDELADTLASIARSSVPVSHVVVSDDGIGERAAHVCTAAPIDVDYLRGPRRGLAPNRNHLLNVVDEDFVVFIDDDCLLGVSFLEAAMDCMERAEHSNGRGRVIVTGTETNRGNLVRAAAQTFLGFQARPYDPEETMTSIVINATLFPRSLFAEHTFDEQIRYGYEEVDLASRAVRTGYTITQCDQAINDHRPSELSRHDYESVMVASRLFVTFKRYALTEHRYGHATAFAVIAPLHAIGAGTKADGVRGAWGAVRAIWRAGRYLLAHSRGARHAVASLP
ncbi:MAG TPA: glycosyltransferase [Solirubrobacteraceae bacterium]|jgi:GT2 family glycosyltransferase